MCNLTPPPDGVNPAPPPARSPGDAARNQPCPDDGCDLNDPADLSELDPAEFDSWKKTLRCRQCGQPFDSCDCDPGPDDVCDLGEAERSGQCFPDDPPPAA